MTQATGVRDDAALLALVARQRDEAAFCELFEHYKRPAFSLAFHVVGDAATAEEVVQESMLRVWKSAGTFKGAIAPAAPGAPGASVKAWIMKIVSRESLLAIRRRKRANRPALAEQEPGAALPKGELESPELIGALQRQLGTLDDSDRQLIALHFGGGMSQSEISKELAVSQQTISYRITRILKDLRVQLGAAGFAALSPLAAQQLEAALLNGQAPPPGLLAGINTRMHAARSIRALRHAPRTAWGMPAAVSVAAVGAFALGLAIWASQPKIRPPLFTAPPTPTVSSTSDPVAAPVSAPNVQPPARKSYRWTFEKGPASELTLLHGNWKWSPQEKAMVADPATLIHLPSIPLAEGPLRVSARIEANADATGLDFGVLLRSNGHAIVKTGWKNRNPPRIDRKITDCYAYIIGPYVIDFLGTNEPNGVMKCSNDHANTELIVSVGGNRLYELSLTPVDPADLPPVLRDIDALTKPMKPMAEGTPEYLAQFDDP